MYKKITLKKRNSEKYIKKCFNFKPKKIKIIYLCKIKAKIVGLSIDIS